MLQFYTMSQRRKRGSYLKASDLLATSGLLATVGSGKPSQVHLRRAVSTTYYALFHCLAGTSADLLIGGSSSERSKHAWVEVYRSLGHGPAKAACEDNKTISKFPQAIQNFADKFVEQQRKRHEADYDPYAKFYKSDVLADIASTKLVVDAFHQASLKDRRAFASWVLFRNIKKN